jgi:anti-sigma B factor antagonist
MEIIQVVPHKNYTEIKVPEILHTNCSVNLKAHIVKLGTEGVKKILFDLEKTRRIDHAGLSALLVANRLCKNAEGKIVLCNANVAVKKLLEIAQLHSILHTCDSLSEGIEYLEKEVVD